MVNTQLVDGCAYLPRDRLLAIADGVDLPERAEGGVLVADISGFTPLTETLTREFGARRGAEELGHRLDAMFSALIERVHSHGGTVIGFGGDSLTCWFKDDDGSHGVACAHQLHEIFGRVATRWDSPADAKPLALKTSVVAGAARRLVVGDEATLRFDVLVGAAVDRAVAGEAAARPGEVLVDDATCVRLAPVLHRLEGRQTERGDGFASVDVGALEVQPRPWPQVPVHLLSEKMIRPWVLPAIFERLRSGQGRFVSESRSAVVMFLCCEGLDFVRNPEAGCVLDAYVRWVQSVLNRFGGTLLQIAPRSGMTQLLAVFGAPVAVEQGPDRAVEAALELRRPPPHLAEVGAVRIGLSWGRLHACDYGGARRTYTVLGDETNLAARLAVKAREFHVLATGRLVGATQGRYRTREAGQLPVKGKKIAVSLFEVLDQEAPPQRVGRRQPIELVGRREERETLSETLQALIRAGESSTLVVEGEAGIGKSRLVRDFLDHASYLGVAARMVAGNAIDRSTAYGPWRSLFEELCPMPAGADPARSLDQASQFVRTLDESLAEHTPLLDAVLSVDLPDNELTAAMVGQTRAVNTNELLTRLLAASAADQPLVIVVEDAHWLDSASWALLRRVRQILDPLMTVISTRPPDPLDSENTPLGTEYKRLLDEDGVRVLRLGSLSAEEATMLASKRLGVDALPSAVADLIGERAAGHPFFCEELAYALRDAGVIEVRGEQCRLVGDVGEWRDLVVPDTVQEVITSRIDRLQHGEQLILKVGSVIGRVFSASTLREIYPVADTRDLLPQYLDNLEHLDILLLERSGSDVAYSFKHVITQEVSYNLLTFAQRRALHAAVAQWYERTSASDLTSHYATLANHWDRAEEPGPAIRYYSLAIEQALARYANREAIGLLDRANDLVETRLAAHPAFERAKLDQQRGEALFRLGRLPESNEASLSALTRLDQQVPPTALGLARGILEHLGRQAMVRFRRLRPGGRASSADRLALALYDRVAELAFANNDLLVTFYGTVRSLDITEEIGVSGELAHAYAKMTLAFGAMPVHRIARRYQQLALETLPQADEVTRGDVLWSLSIYDAGLGDWQTAEKRAALAMESFERLGQWSRWGISLEILSRIAYNRGAFARLDGVATQLARVVDRTGDLLQQSWVYLNRLEHSLFATERGTDALFLAERALSLIAKTKETGTVMMGNALLAVAQLRSRNTEAARDAADRALEVIASAKTASFGMFVAHANTAAVHLALWEEASASSAQHDRRQASRACKALARFAGVFPFARPRVLISRGLTFWLRGQESRAFRAWEEARSLAERLEMPYETALAHFETGRRLSATEGARRQHLQMAQKGFLLCDAHYDLGRTQVLLQQQDDPNSRTH